jgi:hypothetical protein
MANDLHLLLLDVSNEPVTHGPPPSRSEACGVLGQIYLRLAAPGPGAEAGPFTEQEHATMRRLHYLHEVEMGTLPRAVGAPAAARVSQNVVSSRLRRELRREFGVLPCPYAVPRRDRERAVNAIAAQLLTHSARLGFQPTDVRLFDVHGVRAVAGRHGNGLRARVAAWNAASPPPELPGRHTGPYAWDPCDPLGTGDGSLDLARARLVLSWTGVEPASP